MSLRDLSRDFFCSRQAFFPVHLVELLTLGWPFYRYYKQAKNKENSLPKNS